MKRVVATLLSLSLLGTASFAKSSAPKKSGDISKTKSEKIAKLKKKKEIIEKRISCIQKASSAKEIKECEKRYPLVKRGKKSSLLKKKMKKKQKKQKKTK